eukprot:3748928-Heterocapsa_arctica.AAC.1
MICALYGECVQTTSALRPAIHTTYMCRCKRVYIGRRAVYCRSVSLSVTHHYPDSWVGSWAAQAKASQMIATAAQALLDVRCTCSGGPGGSAQASDFAAGEPEPVAALLKAAQQWAGLATSPAAA